jgi:hypothetical protein
MERGVKSLEFDVKDEPEIKLGEGKNDQEERLRTLERQY